MTCEQVEQATYGQSSGMDRRQVTEKQEYKDDDEFKWTIEKKIWKDSKQEINETKRKFSKDMRSKHVYVNFLRRIWHYCSSLRFDVPSN